LDDNYKLVLFNLETKDITLIDAANLQRVFVSHDNKFTICIYQKSIVLRAIYTKNLSTEIKHNMNFIDYHSGTNILVTDTLEHYRIQTYGSEYKLKKVVIGQNYISDRNIVPNHITIIVDLLFETIISWLPDEILYIELYVHLYTL